MSKPNRPVYAGIDTPTSNSPKNSTRVLLMVFGRQVTSAFSGAGHKERANRWVATWEEFLTRMWDDFTSDNPGLVHVTKRAAADTMEDFVGSLREQGVAPETIELALKRVRSHANS